MLGRQREASRRRRQEHIGRVRRVPFPPDPNSSASTINTVEREIREAGGEALAVQVDTRSEESVVAMLDAVAREFGRIDVIVYNSGAIWWSSVAKTPMKRFRLMQQVNVEGLYATVQAALPHFERNGWRGRVIVAIQSAATPEAEIQKDLRKATIYSDAILEMLRTPAAEISGRLELDEDFLRERGFTDFDKYSLIPGAKPRRIMPAKLPDLTVAEEDDEGVRMDSTTRVKPKI
ncbi:unnamed protein product [Parascedosporium putredinis]|uniref:Uncharacterized protein n=1 Tax=Parascedosporium putredinis TaxID=1442378 RepID=A0A9P1H255_9PEZI|nr:unnamed protein product [Parascedosporium putredinis]CAI7993662.1 unnamed protein product [Parascedosporium putredinis]